MLRQTYIYHTIIGLSFGLLVACGRSDDGKTADELPQLAVQDPFALSDDLYRPDEIYTPDTRVEESLKELEVIEKEVFSNESLKPKHKAKHTEAVAKTTTTQDPKQDQAPVFQDVAIIFPNNDNADQGYTLIIPDQTDTAILRAPNTDEKDEHTDEGIMRGAITEAQRAEKALNHMLQVIAKIPTTPQEPHPAVSAERLAALRHQAEQFVEEYKSLTQFSAKPALDEQGPRFDTVFIVDNTEGNNVLEPVNLDNNNRRGLDPAANINAEELQMFIQFETRINFESGAHTLSQEAHKVLDEIVRDINRDIQNYHQDKPTEKVTFLVHIRGYADAKPFFPTQTEKERQRLNQELSEKRAQAVGNYILSRVKHSPLVEIEQVFEGFGEEIPPRVIPLNEESDPRRRICTVYVMMCSQN
ncbi:OmpA family protein [Eisenibacter elegans]|uniref:OmpA family protein n=1 Tax=Eisenibacter elegans TaxID=997 RepID=UPI0004092F7B|nr:OmpA family protein [Eisenibacter elegans]